MSTDLPDPVFRLWEKDPSRLVTADELVPILGAHFAHAYSPLWEGWDGGQNDWYKARRKGLEAYGRYEAGFRLRQYHKTFFTYEDFMTFHLCDAIGYKRERAISDDFYADLMEHKRQNPTPEFYSLIARKLEQKGRQPNADVKFYSMLYDRADIPFQYWTNEAAADFMTMVYRIHDRSRTFNRDQIKKWKSELLHLKESEPFIITGFHPIKREITELNLQAFAYHSLPVPPDLPPPSVVGFIGPGK